MKKIFVSMLIIFVSFIFADTIIDSVYATPVLDGKITYSQQNQCFVVNNWMYNLYAGDIGDNGFEPPSDNNSFIRSYISFELPEIPEDYQIDSVFVRLYQYNSQGNTGWYQTDPQDFPVWNVPGGDTIQCIVSHIDYGNELDVGDWEKGDTGNPNTYQHNIGVITESGEDGYRYLDVTFSVFQDYELSRDQTQYRIAFDGIDTDWDDLYDNVGFISGNPPIDEYTPIIYFYLTNEVNVEENAIYQVNISLSNYPNPFNPKTKIVFDLPEEGDVQLDIFNIKGQNVKQLVSDQLSVGQHSVVWNGNDSNNKRVSSGIYLYRLQTPNKIITKKMLLLK